MNDGPRKCAECGVGLNEGYLHENTDEAFHSFGCAVKKYGDKYARVLVSAEVLFLTDWHDEVSV